MGAQADGDPLHRLLALAEAAGGPKPTGPPPAQLGLLGGSNGTRMGPPGTDAPVQLSLAEQLAFAHTHSQHGSDWRLLSSRLPRHEPQALARAWQATHIGAGGANGLLARYTAALQQGLTPAASFVACVQGLPLHTQQQPRGAAQQAVQRQDSCSTSGREASQLAAALGGSSGRSQAAMAPPPQRPVQQPLQHWQQGSLAQPPPAPHSMGSPACRTARQSESAVCAALAQLAQQLSDPNKLARVFCHLQGAVAASLRSRQGSNPGAASAASNGAGTGGGNTPPAMAAAAGNGPAAAAVTAGTVMPRPPPEVQHLPPQQRKVERLHAQLQQEQALQPSAPQQQPPAHALPAAPSSKPVQLQVVPAELGGSALLIGVRSMAATREGAAALHALKCLELLPPQLPDDAQLALHVLLPPSWQGPHLTPGGQQQTQQQTLVAASAGAGQADVQQQEGHPVVASPATSMDEDRDSPQLSKELAQPAGVASDVTAAAAEAPAPQQPAAGADSVSAMLKQRAPTSVVIIHAHADGLDSLDSDDAAAVASEAAALAAVGNKGPACAALQQPPGSNGAAAALPAAKRAAVSVQERP